MFFKKTFERKAEEEKEICKKKFEELFGIPIEFVNKYIDDESPILSGIHIYYTLLLNCKNVQEYLEKSKNIKKAIEEIESSSKVFRSNKEKFILDNLLVEDVKDSFYDYARWSGCSAFPFSGHRKEIVPVRRRDFILFDISGKILTFLELERRTDDKKWDEIIYSMNGDKVKATVSYLQDGDDKTGINFCYLYDIKNYSLEERIKK